MNRIVCKWPAYFVLIAMTVWIDALAAQAIPSKSIYRGKSTSEWGALRAEWAIANSLGDEASSPAAEKKMRFLPLTADDQGFAVVKPGIGFVATAYYGWLSIYNDGTEETVEGFLPFGEILFGAQVIEATLDGRVVFSGTATENPGSAFVKELDVPIFFRETPESEDRYAVAATGVFGCGIVIPPLTPGNHRLVIQSEGLATFYSEWIIIVEK